MKTKEDEIMDFLHEKIFDAILVSSTVSPKVKEATQRTISYLQQRDAKGMIEYFWHCVKGSDRSIEFAGQLKQEGFARFEDVMEEFRRRFNEKWLNS
ncbi:MAG: hypothetical protein ABII75_02870 [Candidatus Omnitrophota bacterium]